MEIFGQEKSVFSPVKLNQSFLSRTAGSDYLFFASFMLIICTNQINSNQINFIAIVHVFWDYFDNVFHYD